MWPFRRSVDRGDAGRTLNAEIDALTEALRSRRDPQAERRLMELRHDAGLRLLEANGASPAFATPDSSALPERANGLPELTRADLTPGLLRAGILRDGCVLVRGLIDRDTALGLAAEIDRAFAEREKALAGEAPSPGYYEGFNAQPPHDFGIEVRAWVKQGGGLLAADSPKFTAELLELLRATGLRQLVREYLGEPPLISLHKTTLRKAEPAVGGGWHQDGKFMRDVRALNLWLALSRCGDEAPGLDIVPRRLDGLVEAATDEAVLWYQVSDAKAREAAGDAGVARPVFEPGDALFFDELFLHKTAADPSMPKPRFAVETWFFGPSGFPADYGPLAV